MRLYHYSNTDIKDKIKVNYYGANFYTYNDTNITKIKRAFYYTRPEPEHLLSRCKFLYIIEYPDFRIYDITQDKRGYLQNKTITEALYKIKQKYNGVIYNIGNREIVNLFYDVKIKNKIILERGD